MFMIDGILYEKESDAPDLGSIVCTGHGTGEMTMVRQYKGLSKDLDKLPKYVMSGSTCFMVDTGELYMYEATTETWYKQ